MSIFSFFKTFATTKAWPFVENIGKQVVQAEIHGLEPIAAELVASSEAAIAAAIAAGSISGLGGVLATLIQGTAAKAEAQAIGVGTTSLLSAVGAALSANANISGSLAIPAPKAQP